MYCGNRRFRLFQKRIDGLSHNAPRVWRSICLALFAALLFTGPDGIVAAQSFLPELGGQGGSAFSQTCPDGQNLRGFALRAADDVDAIRPICLIEGATGLAAVAGSIGVAAGVGDWHGGSGGAETRVVCPPRTPVVLGIWVESEGVDTVIVNSISLFCGLATANQPIPAYPTAIFEAPHYQPSKPALGFDVGGASAFPSTDGENCPSGEVAIGVHGRSGVWLDAMGLICDAPRRAAPRVPPSNPIGDVVGGVGGFLKAPPRPSGPTKTICEEARGARALNSPTAPDLEAKCRTTPEVVASIGRIGPKTPRPAEPKSICQAATDARVRNSPAAPRLEAQCRAYQASHPPPAAPAPVADPAAAPDPVPAPDPAADDNAPPPRP